MAVQVACRFGAGIDIRTVGSEERVGGVLASASGARIERFSRDGRLFAFSTPQGVSVVDASTGSQLHYFTLDRVSDVCFSPLATRIATWQRPENAPKGENLCVFDLRTGERVGVFSQRAQTGWCPQWTDDEVCCVRIGNSGVHVLDGTQLDKIVGRIDMDVVGCIEVAPGPAPYKLAVFMPEKNGAPAYVRIYLLSSLAAPAAQRAFFKADRVQIKWDAAGTRALIVTQTEVDTTGKSYFGESSLYFIDSQGKNDGHIALDKAGPVHDVAWSPTGREFIAVYGTMPAKAKLFNNRAVEIADFGVASRNEVYFNKDGTLICLAGFGNLNGDMEIWSRHPLQRLCTIAGRDTTFMEWCPDGRHLLGATLSPRLRVDNGYRIWHYRGALVEQRAYNELLQVSSRPATYPQRPLTPPPAGGFASVAAAATTSAPAEPPKAAYIPPHLRGKVAAATAAPRSLYELAGEDVGASKAGLIKPKPGAVDEIAEAEKKLKTTQKKIKAIEELKALRAQGKPLEKNQLDKIASEGQLIKERDDLTKLIAKLGF